MLELVDKALSSLPRGTLLALAVALVAGVGFADYTTGAEVSFSIFYLAPVAIAAWYVGSAAGGSVSVAAALIWYAADIGAGHAYSHPIIPMWNAFVRLGIFTITSALLSKAKAQMAQLRLLADTDGLTGLQNARSFFEFAGQEMNRSKRYARAFTLAYVDLDNFKTVNDTRGHEEGDRALRVVAETLRSHTRDTDTVGRLGGDEFAILFPETGSSAAIETLEKLRGLLGEKMKSHEWPVTFSCGAVTFERPMDSVKEMVKAADSLMYQVKKSGKDRISHQVWPSNDMAVGEPVC